MPFSFAFQSPVSATPDHLARRRSRPRHAQCSLPSSQPALQDHRPPAQSVKPLHSDGPFKLLYALPHVVKPGNPSVLAISTISELLVPAARAACGGFPVRPHLKTRPFRRFPGLPLCRCAASEYHCDHDRSRDPSYRYFSFVLSFYHWFSRFLGFNFKETVEIICAVPSADKAHYISGVVVASVRSAPGAAPRAIYMGSRLCTASPKQCLNRLCSNVRNIT